jgi:hypothetical protein
MRSCRRLLPIAIHAALGLLVLEGAVYADERADEPKGREQALRLFDEARAEMSEGRYAEACAKFAASNALDPGAGTMLNLAYCYEKIGQKARAWVEYGSAAVAARRDGKIDWEGAAHARAARLEPSLAWIVVRLAQPLQARDLDIRLDGEPLAAIGEEHPAPADAGTHRLFVSAVGKRSWTTTFEVEEHQSPIIEVPALEPEPTPVVERRPPSPERPAGRSGLDPRRIAAVAMAAASVASLGVAAGFAVSARTTYDGADCGAGGCTRSGRSAQSAAYRQAAVASVTAASGLGAAIGAGVLWWTATHSRGVRVEPLAGPTACGISLWGEW